MLGTVAIMFAGLGFNPFGLSILYFVLLTPFSFICWYRPIYKVSVYMLGTMAIMFAGLGFNPFGLSILYFVLLTPFSFVCWYRPIYKRAIMFAGLGFNPFGLSILYFVLLTPFSFVCWYRPIYKAIGIPEGGFCGLLTSIKTFNSSIAVGIITLFIAIGFIVSAVANVLLMAKVHRIYRSTGASLAKAQAEFTTEILRNQHVQTAASNAAAAAVNAQIANNRR
ncbi:SCAMP family domain-containing protein [Phthorimaea operculella]|nr:SCAMP family domain-containing protein [Phthorimaea operculella]